MSIKERTAITLAGHRADAVTWFSAAAGGFVTSSAYTSAPVPFVAAFAQANPMTADLGKVWTRTLPAERYLFADAGTGEKPASYWSAEFPHALKAKGDAPDAQFFEAWEASPFSDDYLGRLAIASVDALKLGQGTGTDFLGISFSALDYVGHDFGPTSHEVQDTLVRLDRTIGASARPPRPDRRRRQLRRRALGGSRGRADSRAGCGPRHRRGPARRGPRSRGRAARPRNRPRAWHVRGAQPVLAT